MSKIEWTEKTWNPIVGCSKVSGGCKNCYAIGMAWRLQHIHHSKEKYAGTVEKTAAGQLNWTGKVNTIQSELLKPLKWKKPAMIFVNSESDLFHENIPFEFIDAVFRVMNDVDHHTYQVLTKRPARMVEFYQWKKKQYGIPWQAKSNVWLGVSVENQQAADERIPLLLQVPANVRFLSCEPLLGSVRLDQLSRKEYDMTFYDDCLTGFKAHGAGGWYGSKIDWVIVGGESGKNARPMHLKWARDLRDQCTKAGVKYFFKQWGAWAVGNFSKKSEPCQIWMGDDGIIHDQQPRQMLCYGRQLIAMNKVGKDKAGRILDGREWNEFPDSGKRKEIDDPDFYTTGPDYQ